MLGGGGGGELLQHKIIEQTVRRIKYPQFILSAHLPDADPLLDADPPGCRLPLDADSPLDADPPDADP